MCGMKWNGEWVYALEMKRNAAKINEDSAARGEAVGKSKRLRGVRLFQPFSSYRLGAKPVWMDGFCAAQSGIWF